MQLLSLVVVVSGAFKNSMRSQIFLSEEIRNFAGAEILKYIMPGGVSNYLRQSNHASG